MSEKVKTERVIFLPVYGLLKCIHAMSLAG